MKPLRVSALVVALALGLAPEARGEGAAPEERFDGATSLLAEGRDRAAAEELVALAEAAPEHHLAAEALFAAAEVYEERLAEPARAAALYDRLVRDHPESRRSLAAERRLERLRSALGPGGEGADPLARFTEIKQGFPERPEAESVAMAEELLEAHPEWSGAPRVSLWLAEIHRRAGRLDRAAKRYDEVLERWPESEEAFPARLGAGEIALARGDAAGAERHFRALDPQAEPGRLRAREHALDRLERSRDRSRLEGAAFAAALLALSALAFSLRLAVGSWRGAARALGAPPTEVLYLAPVAALLVAAAYTDFPAAGPAVLVISAGGLAFAWLSGAGLRAAPPGLGRSLAHAAACVVGALSLCYIVLQRLRLLDLVVETLRHGPDA